jgi:hypothetical protein
MGSKYPTSDASPTPPNPLAPPGAGQPNSRMWPTHITEDVQTDQPVVNFNFFHLGLSVGGPKSTLETTDHSAGTSSLQSVGQIRLLAPLSAPAGVERGGGDRGGNKLRGVKVVGGAQQLNWVCHPPWGLEITPRK